MSFSLDAKNYQHIFSLSREIQKEAVAYSNKNTHTFLNGVAARVFILLKVPCALVDVAVHTFLFIGKTFLGVGLLPIRFVAWVIHKDINSNRILRVITIEQGLLHLGHAIIFLIDILALPASLISPKLSSEQIINDLKAELQTARDGEEKLPGGEDLAQPDPRDNGNVVTEDYLREQIAALLLANERLTRELADQKKQDPLQGPVGAQEINNRNSEALGKRVQKEAAAGCASLAFWGHLTEEEKQAVIKLDPDGCREYQEFADDWNDFCYYTQNNERRQNEMRHLIYAQLSDNGFFNEGTQDVVNILENSEEILS